MAKRNLLLVDADPRSLRVLEVSLRKAGYSVTTSGDVDGALELLELVEPDMILSDTRLPGKDGFQLVAALRANSHWADIPLVFLSSDPSVESKMRGLSLGVEDYLTKPVYIREILTRVNLAMQRKEREGIGRTSKTRFAGSLSDMGLVDLLQTIDVSRKSGVLRLSSGARRGSIFFNEGRVLDAELGALTGEPAIYRFLLWSEGEFELDFREVRREDKLSVSTQGLLMEGMRRLDEWSRLQEQLPSMATVFDVNHDELSQRLAEIPDEINVVLRLFDGRRTLAEVLEESATDDLATLNAVSKLYFEGFLVARELPAEEPEELLEDMQIGAIDGPFAGPLDSEALVASAPPEPLPPSVSSLPPSPQTELLASQNASTSAASKPLAAIQLKRVAVNADSLAPGRSLPATEVTAENVRIESLQADARDVPPGAGESRDQQDDMAKHAKRKSAQKDGMQAKGNVIPLPVSRLESAEPTTRSETAKNDAPRAEASRAETPRSESGKPATPSVEAIRSEPAKPEPARPSAPKAEPAKASDAEASAPSVSGRPRAGRRHRRSTLPPSGASVPPTAPLVVPPAPALPAEARPAASAAPTSGPETRASDASAQSGDASARDLHADDHIEVQQFFARPSQATRDFEDAHDHDDHEHDHDHVPGSKRAKQTTIGIAVAGLLLIGGFLLYHKVLMPTPEELAPTPVALPTPDMLRSAPAIEAPPEPKQAPAPAPAQIAPEPAPAPEPSGAEQAPAPEPAVAAPTAEPAAPVAEAPATEAPALPEPSPEYVRELTAARKAGFRRGAEQAYLKALALEPRGAEALSGLAMLYLNQGKNQAARDRAQEAVNVDPKSSEGWIVLAASLSALGDAANARKAYQECAQLEGKYVGECRRMLR